MYLFQLLELVKTGVLPSDKEAVVGVELGAVAEAAVSGFDPNMDATNPCFEPSIALKLKELELELKQEECEAQRIKLRMVEAEKARDIEVRRLELEALKLRGPTPLPCTGRVSASPDAGCAPKFRRDSFDSSFECSPDFDVSKFIRLVPPFRETEVD